MQQDSIVFYCKTCEKMMFACSQSHLDNDARKEIAGLLAEGHIIKTVDKETVKKEFEGCKCDY